MAIDTSLLNTKVIETGGRKIVVMNGDTIADIHISKSDTSPSILYNQTFPKIPELPRGVDWEDVIVPVSFFAVAAFIVYLIIRYSMRRFELRHQERMAAIEKGLPLNSEFHDLVPLLTDEGKIVKPYNPYKWPLILGFVGAAFVVANIIEGDDWGFGLVLIALGVALYLANYLRDKRDLQRLGLRSKPPSPPMKDDNQF